MVLSRKVWPEDRLIQVLFRRPSQWSKFPFIQKLSVVILWVKISSIKSLFVLYFNYFANLINEIFSLRYFPSSWKSIVKFSTCKPGEDRALAKSYRPGFLLDVLNRLVEHNFMTHHQQFYTVHLEQFHQA